MTSSATTLIPDQLVDCIASGREPTVQQLFAQAKRMWIEGAAERSAFAWNRLAPDACERLIALRAARLALAGGNQMALRIPSRRS